MCGRISLPPSEQFTPTMSGLAWRTEFQNASTVCPDRVRPLRSTIVTEIHSGRSGAASRAALIAAFAFSVSKIGLDQQQVHAALGQRGDLLGVGVLHLVEGDGAVRRVVHLRAERQGDVQRADRARHVPVPPASSAACRASWAPRRFIS